MIIAAVAGFCVLILILAFLVPRLSRHPERGGQKVLGTAGRGAGKAPGKRRPLRPQAVRLVAEGRVEERADRPQGPVQDAALASRYGATGCPVASSPARSSRTFSR